MKHRELTAEELERLVPRAEDLFGLWGWLQSVGGRDERIRAELVAWANQVEPERFARWGRKDERGETVLPDRQ